MQCQEPIYQAGFGKQPSALLSSREIANFINKIIVQWFTSFTWIPEHPVPEVSAELEAFVKTMKTAMCHCDTNSILSCVCVCLQYYRCKSVRANVIIVWNCFHDLSYFSHSSINLFILNECWKVRFLHFDLIID